jgi:hypothetical protein
MTNLSHHPLVVLAKKSNHNEYPSCHHRCLPRRRDARCRTKPRRIDHAELQACDSQHSRQITDRRGRRLRTASRPHTHAKSAFIYAYVVSGAIESLVNDGPKPIYHQGESWYETPGAHHAVARNASATEPAKLLAVFVVDTDDKVLTIPDK